MSTYSMKKFSGKPSGGDDKLQPTAAATVQATTQKRLCGDSKNQEWKENTPAEVLLLIFFLSFGFVYLALVYLRTSTPRCTLYTYSYTSYTYIILCVCMYNVYTYIAAPPHLSHVTVLLSRVSLCVSGALLKKKLLSSRHRIRTPRRSMRGRGDFFQSPDARGP